MPVATQHYIAGRREASGSKRFRATDAASREPVEPDFTEATDAEIDAACTAAAEAMSANRPQTLERRATLLESIADALNARAEEFAALAPRETGLPEGRIRGELARTTGQLRLFAGVVRAGDFLGVRIDHGDPQRSPAPKPELREYRVPLGPVAVFGASNFPLAFSVAGGDTASALAAGCPVVVKAHQGHPGTSALAAEAVTEAVESAGFHPGTFSMVQGASHAVGTGLVRHPAIKAVGFTGSHAAGMALTRIAAERDEPIPVYAEMGSVNPLFLLPEALESRREPLAAGLLGSVTLGCGQFCTNPGLVFAVSGEPLEAFIQELAERLEGVDAGVMLHPGILEAYERSRERLEAVPGVETIGLGSGAEGRARTAVYRTTLDQFLSEPALADEIFGPATLIIEVPSAEGLLRAAAALRGQLTAGIHAQPGELAAHGTLIERLENRAGRVLFNGFPTGVEVAHAMVHGGPYPATTHSGTTSVGTLAIERFLRPVCYQDFPEEALPTALREDNPLGLRRFVDGQWDA